jgi:LysM repeat protein
MTLTSRTALLLLALVALLVGGAAFAQDDATPVLEGEVSYTVQVADTLDSIGAFYDVKVECIAELNELSNINTIFPGAELIISDSCPRYGGFDFVTNPRPDASSAFGLQNAPFGDGQGGGGDGAQVWVVGIGDTLDTIGQELNVSVVALQQENEIAPTDALFVGQEIVIPADAPAYGLFPALNEIGNGQGGGGAAGEAYVVQRGDTLDVIGATFDKQVACIAEANSITNVNVIFPGLAIVIPDDCPAYDGGSTP